MDDFIAWTYLIAAIISLVMSIWELRHKHSIHRKVHHAAHQPYELNE